MNKIPTVFRRDADFWTDDARKVAVAHITGWHHLPRDHAHECGLCELEVVKVELKYAQQKLHALGDSFTENDYTAENIHPTARGLADLVRHILASGGCCCCPVGCNECVITDCYCPEHSDDHDTRCLGQPEGATA